MAAKAGRAIGEIRGCNALNAMIDLSLEENLEAHFLTKRILTEVPNISCKMCPAMAAAMYAMRIVFTPLLLAVQSLSTSLMVIATATAVRSSANTCSAARARVNQARRAC